MNTIGSLLAGFSIISALMLMLIYLFALEQMSKTSAGKIACCAVLLGLAGLQYAHFLAFREQLPLLDMRIYCVLLAVLPAAFFFFSREVLFDQTRYQRRDTVHLATVFAACVLPLKLVPVMAFLVGTGYTCWFSVVVFRLREQRGRFKFEIFFFSAFALMAFVALVLGLALPFLEHSVFYYTYSIAISLAMLMVVSALLIFPELLSDLLLVTRSAYASSKLHGVNVDAKLLRLEELMIKDKHYQDEALNLNSLAELVELSPHQLSELINSHFAYGFPRFMREHRIRAAKTLLIAEPSASILSISMMTGFKSQSSFYTAFKELTGESPGSYRRKAFG
ncbi:MAG: helix-turn-helix domain-containing protein [Pseudomonadota bacterium]